jgi:hypothetical protein
MVLFLAPAIVTTVQGPGTPALSCALDLKKQHARISLRRALPASLKTFGDITSIEKGGIDVFSQRGNDAHHTGNNLTTVPLMKYFVN